MGSAIVMGWIGFVGCEIGMISGGVLASMFRGAKRKYIPLIFSLCSGLIFGNLAKGTHYHLFGDAEFRFCIDMVDIGLPRQGWKNEEVDEWYSFIGKFPIISLYLD